MDDDINKNEQFLMYSGQAGRIMLFCAKTELATIHQSEYLVCDGTFEMAPYSSYQLYTIHGYIQGEGLPLMFAILPNKTTATYVEMLAALRTGLVSAFGNIGSVRYVLTDFELAAINAVHQVFPEVQVKGCTFHFRQAILRKLKQEGIQQVYESETLNPVLRSWLRSLMSMSMLPLIWSSLQLPPTTTPDMDTKAGAVAKYFDSTWITGDFPPSMWSHFDHEGPRTTNLAEGLHNSLNSRFGMPHPSMRMFMDWLQKCQFETQCRELQLSAGRPPKQRNSVYKNNDAAIAEAKLKYGISIGQLFAYNFPQGDSWTQFRSFTFEYLGGIGFRIGV